jgi:hypothetical protein
MAEWAEWLREQADRWKNVIDALFTGFLVLFTFLLYLTTNDYAKTARLAERPWIGETFLTDGSGNRLAFGNYTVAANQPIDIGVEYENFGKSPTAESGSDYKIMLAGKPPERDSDWSDFIPFYDCRSSVKGLDAGPLFPNDSHILSQLTSDMLSLSSPDRDDIKAGSKTLILKGCFIYQGSDKRMTYHTDLCMFFYHPNGNASGHWSYCPTANSAE